MSLLGPLFSGKNYDGEKWINMKVKIGIVGCGNHANNHAEIIVKSDYAELTACADIDPERAAQFAQKYGCEHSYGSLEEMISAHKIDLLIIVAFPTVHPQLIKDALNLGVKHILCEKPLALNAKQVEEIKALAEKHDALVVEGLMYRSHPQIMKAKELIESGAIGEVKYIYGQFSDYARLNPDNWRNHRELGGGSMTAKGCYLVDACNLFAGAKAKAAFCIESINEEYNVEAGMTGTIVYENGVTAQFETNHRSVWREELKVCGTKGTIVIPHAIVTKTQKRYIEIQRNGAYEAVPMDTETIEFDVCNSYERQLQNLCDCIMKDAKPNLPLSDSLINYVVTDAILKSAETGRLEPVLWDE